MRTPSIATVSYTPDAPPSELSGLGIYITNELNKVKAAIDALATGHLDKTYVAPKKPRDGDIRYADGTSWNPNSGQGVYYYNGTIWKLLG